MNMSDHSGEREMTSREKAKSLRITSSAKDRDKIREKLLTCIDRWMQMLIPMI